jgi:hypothetical protein
MTLPLTPEQVALVVDVLIAASNNASEERWSGYLPARIAALETAAEYLRVAKIIQEASCSASET